MARKLTGKSLSRAGDKAESGKPGLNPVASLVIADLALRGGGHLLRLAVQRGLLGGKALPQAAKGLGKGGSMARTLIGTALARVATKSVPGAIVVGGGLLAKTLYDRKKAAQKQVGDTTLVGDKGRKA